MEQCPLSLQLLFITPFVQKILVLLLLGVPRRRPRHGHRCANGSFGFKSLLLKRNTWLAVRPVQQIGEAESRKSKNFSDRSSNWMKERKKEGESRGEKGATTYMYAKR